jgi:predicted nucleic acid-binding OB-fold protein
MNFLNEVNHILEELFKNKEIVFVNNYNKAKKISLP